MDPRSLSQITAIGLSVALHMAIIGGALYELRTSITSTPPGLFELRIVGSEPAAARVASSVVSTRAKSQKVNPGMETGPRWHDNVGTYSNAGATQNMGAQDSGVGENDSSPEPLYHPKPRYPEAARQALEEGSVTLVAEVSERGEVLQVVVSESSKNKTLDRAAVEGVRLWTFKPALAAGTPVAAKVEVPVDFRLE